MKITRTSGNHSQLRTSGNNFQLFVVCWESPKLPDSSPSFHRACAPASVWFEPCGLTTEITIVDGIQSYPVVPDSEWRTSGNNSQLFVVCGTWKVPNFQNFLTWFSPSLGTAKYLMLDPGAHPYGLTMGAGESSRVWVASGCSMGCGQSRLPTSTRTQVGKATPTAPSNPGWKGRPLLEGWLITIVDNAWWACNGQSWLMMVELMMVRKC